MFCVFYKDTQPFASPFVPFYAHIMTFSLVPLHANHYLNMQKPSFDKWLPTPCFHLLVSRGSMVAQY